MVSVSAVLITIVITVVVSNVFGFIYYHISLNDFRKGINCKTLTWVEELKVLFGRK